MSGGSGGDDDEIIDQAIEVIMETRKASATLLQRKLNLGFARAARVMDELEKKRDSLTTRWCETERYFVIIYIFYYIILLLMNIIKKVTLFLWFFLIILFWQNAYAEQLCSKIFLRWTANEQTYEELYGFMGSGFVKSYIPR